jgi:hypothetical protein
VEHFTLAECACRSWFRSASHLLERFRYADDAALRDAVAAGRITAETGL